MMSHHQHHHHHHHHQNHARAAMLFECFYKRRRRRKLSYLDPSHNLAVASAQPKALAQNFTEASARHTSNTVMSRDRARSYQSRPRTPNPAQEISAPHSKSSVLGSLEFVKDDFRDVAFGPAHHLLRVFDPLPIVYVYIYIYIYTYIFI